MINSRADAPYGDIRILDLTHGLGRYAPRLFADLGAEVIRVEPPDGLADRRGLRPGTPDPAACAFWQKHNPRAWALAEGAREQLRDGVGGLAMLCKDYVCQAPTADPQVLAQCLRSLQRGAAPALERSAFFASS